MIGLTILYVLGAMAAMSVGGALILLGMSGMTYRPIIDEDWRARVRGYEWLDQHHCGNRPTKLGRVLWALARWAPLGAKMIWRGNQPYIARIYLTPWWSPWQLYLHRIMVSDDAMHNHPWTWSASVLLEGSYDETTSDRLCGWWYWRERKVRWFNFISAHRWHALTLRNGGVWTLFLTGRRTRLWGFMDQDGQYHPLGSPGANLLQSKA